jgi:thymidylate kinase
MQKPFLIIELVGPAGAGKTTLSRVLIDRNPMIQMGLDIELRKTKYVPVILHNAMSLLPLFLKKSIRNGCHFTWEEIKYLIYLAGWPEVLRQEAADGTTAILLDHGPVFKLATLNEFGPEALKTDQFANWWDRMFKQWASTLDMVIWLDAPDKILDQRINSRDQRHSVKGKSESEVVHFLARYRTSYEETLAKLRIAGNTRLLQFDTSRTSIEQVADEILSAFNLSV